MDRGSESIYPVTPRNSGDRAVFPGARNCARDAAVNPTATNAARPRTTIDHWKRHSNIEISNNLEFHDY